MLTDRYHALRNLGSASLANSWIGVASPVAPARTDDALRDRLGGRCHDQRDRVRGDVRDGLRHDRLLDRRVHRRRDPELDPQPPLGVEGRGPRRVRARDRRLRAASRRPRWSSPSLATGWTAAARPEHPRAPRHPGDPRDRRPTSRCWRCCSSRGSSVYEHWIFSGRSRCAPRLRSRHQVWTRGPREPHAVAEVPALLGGGGVLAAVAHRGRHLGQPVAVQRRADHQLRGLVLGLLERHRRGHLRAHRPQPAGRIGDPVADQHADQRAEHEHAGVADARRSSARRPGAGSPRRSRRWPSRIGSTTRADLLGLVLAVGVDRGDHLRAAGTRQPVAELAAPRPGRG